MSRPQIVSLVSLESDEHIHLRISLTFSTHAQYHLIDELQQNLINLVPTKPIQSLGLMRADEFRVKVIGLSKSGKEIITRYFDSDSFGDFYFKIPQENLDPIEKLKIFETKTHPGLELLLGHFIPTKIKNPKKILITDFDKTLVDTRYSTAKELYQSLRNPVDFFPPVKSSIEIMNKYMSSDFQPFVVSASPHFYANAIRDWLYQNQVFTAHIFLKDYRRIFSLFEGDLSPKDLKTQGFYKLNKIVDILMMTGIPQDLILVGDGFESDTLIYLTLASIIIGNQDPWYIWNMIKKEESFKLTNRQHVRFLTKIYHLKNIAQNQTKGNIKIYIRCKEHMLEKLKSRTFSLPFAENLKHLVEYYVG